MKNNIPEKTHRYLLGKDKFSFACNDEVPCFTRCCKDADMFLYPYDIIRLKHRLGMTSEVFLLEHTITAFRDNPNFPSVMLKMSQKKENPCPFLTSQGCSVYEDRPYSCRAYPLEPAMYGDGEQNIGMTFYIVRHDHCKGHNLGKKWTGESWMKDQGMDIYNEHNIAWARVAALLQNIKPLDGNSAKNPVMDMAYMASYNMDTFRRFVLESSFLNRFDVPAGRLKKIKTDDTALMHLGFDWILKFVGNQGSLKQK
jgi:Fe-S-cluster containining protein